MSRNQTRKMFIFLYTTITIIISMRYPWQLGSLICSPWIMGRDWYKGTLPGPCLFNSWNKSIFPWLICQRVYLRMGETSEVVCTVVQWKQQQQEWGFGKVAPLTTFLHHWLSCQIKSHLDNAAFQVKPSDIYNVTHILVGKYFLLHIAHKYFLVALDFTISSSRRLTKLWRCLFDWSLLTPTLSALDWKLTNWPPLSSSCLRIPYF